METRYRGHDACYVTTAHEASMFIEKQYSWLKEHDVNRLAVALSVPRFIGGFPVSMYMQLHCTAPGLYKTL